MDVLHDIWREACRHIQLEASIGRLVELIARTLPADGALVRRIDPGEGIAETMAMKLSGAPPEELSAWQSLTEADVEVLRAWMERGAVAAPGSEALALLVPAALRGDFLAVPLTTERGERGALVLVCQPPRRFGESDRREALRLIEPFSAAFENHHRLRETERLREATEAENRALKDRLGRHDIVEAVVGEDGGLREVMRQISRVAATSAPVLLLGETGTGKEVAARTLHARSRRAHGPILRVNCGAISPELVDSELFGHEKGSFTGASQRRKGWFERADGGTLFLDEVGELPQAAQVRLLRVLQDGTFERVGGEEMLTADVRVVAATNRQMETRVRSGAFREDLWYRLSVFPIEMPPLRERREDLPELARTFAADAGRRLSGAPLVPSPKDISRLLAYDWPGNVRELKAVIERAAILGDGQRLDIAGALGKREEADPAPSPRDGVGAASGAEVASMDEAMRRHIERALRASGGQVGGAGGAAALLDLNPSTLRGRMRRLGVDWTAFRRGSEAA